MCLNIWPSQMITKEHSLVRCSPESFHWQQTEAAAFPLDDFYIDIF